MPSETIRVTVSTRKELKDSLFISIYSSKFDMLSPTLSNGTTAHN